jgi:hypothetical protein
MSGVHDAIALQALTVLPSEERRVFAPFRDELKTSSWYGDTFADRTMSDEAKRAIDPEADRFIDPDPPRTATTRRIWKLTEREAENCVAPLRSVHSAEYFLRQAVASLAAGDARSAVKFCGAFSHIIGDTGEPIHAVPPEVVDRVVPPPPRYIGLELHAGIEGLAAPVRIAGYPPRALGETVPQAVMGIYAGLVETKRIGGAQAVPIAQALYAGNRKKAVRLSQLAQNQSARLTADFMHTVFHLARSGRPARPQPLDLRTYPWAACQVDMLYRYRPTVDVSLLPYQPGKFHPLALATGRKGAPERVKGLGMIPYLGPPWVKENYREASIEYFLMPGAFRTFRARVGANPLFRESICACVFRVLAGGKELYRSPTLKRNDRPQPVEVALGKVAWLTLSMHYTKESNATFEDFQRLHVRFALHGVWAEPMLFA